MTQIAEIDIVIATRFHNIVCALLMHKPVISIGYAKKNDVLLSDMGLSAYVQHIETLDVERLKQQFSALQAEKEQARSRIQIKISTYRDVLHAQDDMLIFERCNKVYSHFYLFP